MLDHTGERILCVHVHFYFSKTVELSHFFSLIKATQNFMTLVHSHTTPEHGCTWKKN